MLHLVKQAPKRTCGFGESRRVKGQTCSATCQVPPWEQSAAGGALLGVAALDTHRAGRPGGLSFETGQSVTWQPICQNRWYIYHDGEPVAIVVWNPDMETTEDLAEAALLCSLRPHSTVDNDIFSGFL